MTESNQQLVVKPHRPGQRKLELILWGCSTVFLFALGLILGMQYFGTAMMEKRKEHRELTDLRQQVVSLEQRLANSELANRVDSVALEEVRQLVASLQTELAVDKEELGLYRNLLKKDDSVTGLLVGDLMLRQSSNQEGIAYRLVVQQKETKLKRIKVNIQIIVKGSQNGKQQTLSLDVLDGQIEASPIQVEFKYFHILEGLMTLSPDFVPTELTAEVWKEGTKKIADKSRVTQSFAWQVDQH